MSNYFTHNDLDYFLKNIDNELKEEDIGTDAFGTRCFYDEEEDKFIEFVMPDKMTANWLADKIFVSPSSPISIDPHALAEILLKYFDKNMLVTLNRIYLVYGDTDNDAVEELSGTDEAQYVFDTDRFVGLMWFSENSVFVDLKQHYDAAKDVAEEFFTSVDNEYEYTIIETLVHELRHLMMDTDIAMDDGFRPIEERNEDAVENYCRNEMDKYMQTCSESFTR